MEQPPGDRSLRAGEGVQQRGLAGVGVARQRDRRQVRALALGAHRAARGLRPLQAPLERGDPVARQAAVGLDLALARAPGADTGAQALEMGPQAAHAGEVVLELRQLDLQLALGGVRVPGEDVEDHRGAVQHGHPHLLLEVALLPRRELVVDHHQVRVCFLHGGLELRQLPAPEVAVGVRLRAPLRHLPRRRDARGAQQLAQLLEVRLVGWRRDQERTLARARVANALAVADSPVRPWRFRSMLRV